MIDSAGLVGLVWGVQECCMVECDDSSRVYMSTTVDCRIWREVRFERRIWRGVRFDCAIWRGVRCESEIVMSFETDSEWTVGGEYQRGSGLELIQIAQVRTGSSVTMDSSSAWVLIRSGHVRTDSSVKVSTGSIEAIKNVQSRVTEFTFPTISRQFYKRHGVAVA